MLIRVTWPHHSWWTLEWLPRQRLAWSELKKTENFVFLVLAVEPEPALARQVLYH